MKKQYLINALCGVAFTLLGTAAAQAYDFEVDGIYYNITDRVIREVEVTSYNILGSASYSGDVVIPGSVSYNGKTYQVTGIGDRAFYDCNELTSVNIPEGVTSIGDFAFDACGFTSITIPDRLTSIGNYAFHDCSLLASIIIPNGVRIIGTGAFGGCSRLTSVAIPDGVTSIGARAFYDCNSLPSVTVPSGTIGEYAFYNCDNLASVTVGDGVTSIGNDAFSSCVSLTSVVIGNGVISIGSLAFFNCGNLTSVIIGNGVTNIGNNAFQSCSNLTSVIIGGGIKSIGDYAFSGCWGLQEIYCYASVPPTADGASLNHAPTNATLYVPCGSEDAYRATEGWNSFSNIIGVARYNVQVLVNNNNMGIAGVKQPVSCETSEAIIEAVANEGYCFAKWSDGNTDNPRTVTVTSDTTFTALFATAYHVYAKSSNQYMGSVTGSGEYAYGTTATLEAVPNEGYHFVRWSDGSTENPRTLTVTEDISLTAEFEAIMYQVSISTNNPDMGSVTGSGEYAHGTTVTIAAIPAEGYRFVRWSDGNTDNPRTLTATEDISLTAEFELVLHQVTVSANDPTMGSVVGSGTYEQGATATIAAIPAEGYRFVQWSDGNADNPRTLTVTKDISLTAEFASATESGIDDITQQFVVTTDHHNILVHGAADNALSVYNVQGVCLYHGTAEADPAIIPVPLAGLYVIMAGEEMVKVVVR